MAAATAAADVTPERTVYAATGGRKTLFSFLFLILLPFFISLPAMIFMRATNGHGFDVVGLAIMATAFAILMFLIVIELVFSLRTRIELGKDSVKMTLPSGRGPTPMLRYVSHDVAYDQVQAVETRREIYGGALVPVMLKGARLILKDGKSVSLGYVSEANVDPAFPYPAIAHQIASRARLPLIDRGSVRRSLRRKFFGFKSGGVSEVDTVDESQIDKLNRSHATVVLGLVGALVLLIVVGIMDDISSGGLAGDWGTQSVTAAPEPPAKPKK